jgi:hypothetical protein
MGGPGLQPVGLAGAASAELVGGVVQLRPEDAMVEAMLRGWRAQQAARGLRANTAGYRERLVRRFQAFTNEFPWQWRPAHVDEWTLMLTAERHLAPATVRGYQTDLCPGCGATHVLLPAWCLSRRADEGAVIGSALQAAAAGAGHRTIAAGLGRPASTVRGWLRRFAARAEAVRAFFTVLLARTSPDPVMPTGAAGPVAAAVSAIAGAAAVAQRWPRVGSVPVWTAASAASGRLLIAPGWPGAGRYTN